MRKQTTLEQAARRTSSHAPIAQHWSLDSYRPCADSFVVMSTDPAGIAHEEDIAEFARLIPTREWGESLSAAKHMEVLHQSLQRRFTGRSIGMGMVAPFEVFLDYEVVGTYDSEEEAEEHYQRLRKQFWPEQCGPAPAAASVFRDSLAISA